NLADIVERVLRSHSQIAEAVAIEIAPRQRFRCFDAARVRTAGKRPRTKESRRRSSETRGGTRKDHYSANRVCAHRCLAREPDGQIRKAIMVEIARSERCAETVAFFNHSVARSK